MNASAFRYNYHDIQVNVVGPLPPTNTAVSYLQNVSAGHANGGELEIDSLPVHNLHFGGSLGLLDTKFTNFQVLNGGTNYSGNQFVRSPHVSTILVADYRFPLGSGRVPKLVFAGDWHFQTKQFFYATNQTDPAPAESAPGLPRSSTGEISRWSAPKREGLAHALRRQSGRRPLPATLAAARSSGGHRRRRGLWGDPRTIAGFSLLARWW